MILAVLAWSPAPALAQAPGDPGSIERTIPKAEDEPAADDRTVLTPALPASDGQQVAGTFVLGAVNIRGATVFGSAELAQSFEPYLASRVGQAELEKITDSITDRYRRDGYLLSYATLPSQLVQTGIVQIRVVEGFVDEVRVEGGGPSAVAVRAIVARLRSERPLRTSTLERVLGLARAVPGVTVTDARISRSPDDPARHRLVIEIRADPVRALAYTDNRGTIDGARLRGYSSFSFSKLPIPGSQLQVDLFTIPSDAFRFHYGQAKVALPLNADGLRFSASASRGDQLRKVAGADQHGDMRQLVAEFSYPFVRSRALSLVGHASLGDWKSDEKRAGAFIHRDRLQVARLWLGVTRTKSTRLEARVGISQGIDLDSATKAGDPLASRPGAGARFTSFQAEVKLSEPIAERLLLRLETSAQYSTEPLLAVEEFALGGSRIGRAFDFNEITGDHGIGAMFELRYRVGDIAKGPRALDLYAYVDGGGAFRIRPSAGLPEEQWLASAGVGARFSMIGAIWSGEIGIPIARSMSDRGVRAFFSIAKPL